MENLTFLAHFMDENLCNTKNHECVRVSIGLIGQGHGSVSSKQLFYRNICLIVY